MSVLHLFLTFFKIGLFTIGGGYAMIPLIQEEVIANGWMTSKELINFVAIAESTPGPFAINIATFIGYNTKGFFGAVVTTIGVVLPSFIIILIIAILLKGFQDNVFVVRAMSLLRPVVVGLVIVAAISIGISPFNILPSFNFVTIYNAIDIRALIIFVVVLGMYIWKQKIHPIIIIGISAVLGIFIYAI